MPLASEMVKERFLKVEDVSPDEDVMLTVAGTALEDMPEQQGKKPESKWVLYFHEIKKGLVLNNTNIKAMAAAYGDNTDGWVGKEVTLWNDTSVKFNNRVGSLKLRTQNRKTVRPVVKPDDIPFNDPIP